MEVFFGVEKFFQDACFYVPYLQHHTKRDLTSPLSVTVSEGFDNQNRVASFSPPGKKFRLPTSGSSLSNGFAYPVNGVRRIVSVGFEL